MDGGSIPPSSTAQKILVGNASEFHHLLRTAPRAAKRILAIALERAEANDAA